MCSHSQYLVKYTEKLSGKVKLVSIYSHVFFFINQKLLWTLNYLVCVVPVDCLFPHQTRVPRWGWGVAFVCCIDMTWHETHHKRSDSNACRITLPILVIPKLSYINIQWYLLIQTSFDLNTSQSEHIWRTIFVLQSERGLPIQTQTHAAADAIFPPIGQSRLHFVVNTSLFVVLDIFACFLEISPHYGSQESEK